jgi:hypothetical protein
MVAGISNNTSEAVPGGIRTPAVRQTFQGSRCGEPWSFRVWQKCADDDRRVPPDQAWISLTRSIGPYVIAKCPFVLVILNPFIAVSPGNSQLLTL